MKKVLIITYYWPPAGGPGVQRVLKFAKYLPEFGWQPVILTVENGEYPAIDESLLDEIPEGIKVYKTKSFEPFNLYKGLSGQKGNLPTHILSKSENESFVQKLSKWLRANVFIPDARVGWIPSIVKEGKKIIDIEKPDIIFSSSPPHSLQIGAMKLAKRSGLKWVADFRDPWRNAFWQSDINRSNFSDEKDKRLEREVISNTNAATSVSKSIISDFSKLNSNRFFVLPNGYDENDFQNIEKKQSNKFRINYTGTLGKLQQIDNFLSALNSLEKDLLGKIEINFYGSIHESIRQNIYEARLTKVIKINPGVSHKEAIKIMVNSEILLLVIPNINNNNGIVTGKLFEYLAANNYVLGIGPIDGDAANILIETNCGYIFDYKDDLQDIIRLRITSWQKNEKLNFSKKAVNEYSRKKTTKKLSEIFAEVL